jgi:predicted TPR repeat methyltransferase
MTLPDYSEFLKQPGKLEAEETAWLSNPQMHDEYASVVNDFIEKRKIKRIIEFGCGTGEVASRLLNTKFYTGVDSNIECIEYAKSKNKDVSFYVSDIREYQQYYIKHGLVICFAFLKHFGLHEWFDVFKKIASFGEYFIFNMGIGPETKDDFYEFHHVWKSKQDIINDIEAAGLELIEIVNPATLEPIFICKHNP